MMVSRIARVRGAWQAWAMAWMARFALVSPAILGAALALGCSDNKAQPGGDAAVHPDAGPQGDADLGGDGSSDDDDAAVVPCMGPTDPRVLVASQRIVHLSKLQFLNTIRALLGDGVANAIVSNDSFMGIASESDIRVPVLASVGESETINSDPDSFPELTGMAEAVADYVFQHFQEVTACAPGDDGCAVTFVNKLATAAFRRPLAADEGQRVVAVYQSSKNQVVNGWLVTSTVEEATRDAVYAIFAAPQTLWRNELGNPRAASGPLPGAPLTDYELASELSYFLTGGPPDGPLLAAAAGGTLRTNLDAQTTRLLATPAAHTWLTTMMFAAIGLNRLFEVRVDPNAFPAILGTTLQDMYTEAKMFLDDAFWNGTLQDVLLSHKTFVNANLATAIYGISPPAGATDTTFAAATLPAAQRSGLLTNAAFITLRVRDIRESLVFRAQLIDQTFLCSSPDGPPEELRMAVATAGALIPTQTAQEQVAFRRANPACNRCHKTFDAYGLSLDGYDNIGRTRTMVTLADGRVVPVDPHTTLPEALGGGNINGAIDLANALAKSDLYPACMAKRVLETALAELSAFVEFPTPADLSTGDEPPAGCAVRALADKLASTGGKTLSDVVRAVVVSPTFLLRNIDPDDGADASGTDMPPASTDGGQPVDGGGAGDAGQAPAAPDVLKTLVVKRTVLDFVLNEITRMQRAVPPLSRDKLDFHAQAVRDTASFIANSIRNVGTPPSN
jgi:hypothetical protein